MTSSAAQAATMCSAVARARGRSLEWTGMGPNGASRSAAARAWSSPSGVSGWSLCPISVPPMLPVDWPCRTRYSFMR